MRGPSENPIKRIIGEIHRRSLWQVLAIYVVSGWVVYEVVQSLTEGLGLPGWFPAFAFVLLLIGLPVVLATAFVQEGGPARRSGVSPAELDQIFSEADTADEAGGSSFRSLFTWRNAILGGMAAFALWGVVAAGWLVWGSRAGSAGLGGSSPDEDRPSLAVLPFDNMSPDPDNAYFADGIHEEILTQLSKVGGFKLISRTSVLRYEDTEKTLAQIADELGVSTVLEGSVQRAGDRVRITTQLVDAQSDEHLWAERYDRELSDIFAIQTEVATRVVEQLKGVLTPGERTELAERPTDDVEAYAHYLRGHQHFQARLDEEEARSAADAYQRAVHLDPDFVAAWSRLVHARVWLSWNFNDYAQQDRAKAALERLVELAPGSRQLRLARGIWLYYGELRFEEALQEFEALAPLWPGNVDVTKFRGFLYRRTGRWEEAVRTMERALELDPADPSLAWVTSQTYFRMRRFDEAERYAKLTMSLDPRWWGRLFSTRLARGDLAGARKVLDSVTLSLGEETVESRWASRALLNASGSTEELLTWCLEHGLPSRGGRADLCLATASVAGRNDVIELFADSLRAQSEIELAAIPTDQPSSRPDQAALLSELAVAQAYLGNEVEAVRLADRAVQLYPVSHDAFTGVNAAFYQARVYTVVGRHDEAVDQLRHLLSIPAWGITVSWLRMDHRWAPLRDHPRFQALLEEYAER